MATKIFFLCFLYTAAVTAQNDFSLDGKTAGFDDGSYLYIRDLVNGGNIDSALVEQNSFRFTTDLPEPTLFVMLFTRDKKHFTELWLEERPMTFDASNDIFKEAKVTGSANHALFKEMNRKLYADVLEVEDEVLKQREIEFVKHNPNALVSAYILYTNQKLNQDEVAESFSLLSHEVQRSSLGQKIARDLEKDLPETGESYVNVSIPGTDGVIVKISDLLQELTLLQFWSSGCAFSRTMNQDLKELYKKYRGEGLEIIGISKDVEKSSWQRAITEDETLWPQVSNLKSWDGEAFRAYGIRATPSNVLIDKNGIIIGSNLRGEELEKQIKKVLEK